MDQYTYAEVWGNIQQLMSATQPHYGEVVYQAIQDVGLEGLRLGLLLHTFQFEPKPITSVALQKTIPYYATAPFEEGFQKLAMHGFLEADNDSYTLSKKGREALKAVFGTARQKLANIENSLPSELIDGLYTLLKRLNNAANDDPIVGEKLCFDMQRKTLQSQLPSKLSDIEDYVGNLYGFRCDVHRHVWQHLDVELDGPTWEALTTIWLGDAHSATTITENRLNARPTRGFTEEVYAQALEKLTEYGWIEIEDEEIKTYRLTEVGQKVRQDAEDETDRLFYRIWSILNDEEVEELNTKSSQLCELLTQPIT